MLSTYRNRAVILAGSIVLWSITALAAEPPADTVYRNGYVYTVDAQNSIGQALAVRDGKIVYVGNNQGADGFVSAETTICLLYTSPSPRDRS